MSTRKHLPFAFVLAAAAAVLGLTVAPATASGECKPPCFKHPITGQLICGHPCP